MIARWSGRRGDQTLADLVFSEARYLLRERNVLLEIILVERRCILGSLVHHHELSHRALLPQTDAATDPIGRRQENKALMDQVATPARQATRAAVSTTSSRTSASAAR